MVLIWANNNNTSERLTDKLEFEGDYTVLPFAFIKQLKYLDIIRGTEVGEHIVKKS